MQRWCLPIHDIGRLKVLWCSVSSPLVFPAAFCGSFVMAEAEAAAGKKRKHQAFTASEKIWLLVT